MVMWDGAPGLQRDRADERTKQGMRWENGTVGVRTAGVSIHPSKSMDYRKWDGLLGFGATSRTAVVVRNRSEW